MQIGSTHRHGRGARATGHTAILPVPAKPNRAVLNALEYAMSISKDVIAVHVKTGGQEREAVLARWKKFAAGVPLIVLDSPNRSVLRPLVDFIDEVRDLRGDDKISVVLPWLVPTRWWHNLLHNWVCKALRDELRSHPGIFVTAVPYHLREAVEGELKHT